MPSLSDPYNGGYSVASYHLQYDDASSGTIWTDLVGLSTNSTTLTYTVSSSIQIGYVYKFRYRAKNIYGWGSYSDTLSLYAASAPT